MVIKEDPERILIEGYKKHFKEVTGKELVAFINDVRSIPLDSLYEMSKEYFKIDTIRKCRRIEYVTARIMLFKEARRMGYKLVEIGRAYGYDHTSVISSINNKRITWDDFNKDYTRFQSYIKSQKEILNKKLDIAAQ